MIKFIRYYKKTFTVIFSVVFLALMAFLIYKTNTLSDRPEIESTTYPGEAMGTTVKKVIYSADAAERDKTNIAVNQRLKELDEEMSVRNVDSPISACNRNYPIGIVYALPDEIVKCLKVEQEVAEDTGGAFCPCIRPLTELWGIEDGEVSVIPSKEQIDEVLPRINYKNFKATDTGVVLEQDGMKIDLGAAGKGAACEFLKETLAETKCSGAMIQVGGSVLVYGNKGYGDDEWHIGIRHPRSDDNEKAIGIVDTKGGSVISTSGDYEKYFIANNKRYHHIFDASTGYPAQTGVISVTVISDDGIMSDVMSTAIFVMGAKNGLKYAKKKGVEAVIITDEKKIYVTDGMRDKFRLKDDEYTVVE